MKKLLTFTLIFLFIGLSILPTVSSIKVITQNFVISSSIIRVDDDGDGDFTSIQDAIDNATDGDIIEVYSGTYIEINMLIDKQLTLLGKNIELGGGNSSGKPLIIIEEGDRLFRVEANGCSISGFFMEIGLRLRNASDNMIYENIIQGFNINIGISINYYSHNNSVYSNYIKVNAQGIYILGYSEYNIIYNNTIDAYFNYFYGIVVYNSNNNSIYKNRIMNGGTIGIGFSMETEAEYGAIVYDNEISNCHNGIRITGRRHKIYHNNISDCEYGIVMEKIDTNPPSHCYMNDVYENNIINSVTAGIFLKGVYTSNIYRNNITDGEIWGLEIIEAELNNIFENNITYNYIGIDMWDCEDNTVYHNNFIGNSVNAKSYGDPCRNYWNLGYTKDGGGNYWDDYKGKDRNGDKVGDIPYIIPDGDYNPFNNDKDEYPLMEPNGRPNHKMKNVSRQPYSNLLFSLFLDNFLVLQKQFQRLVLQ